MRRLLPADNKDALPSLEKEIALLEQGYLFIAGLDEAGRGAWAGPVVAAAVILSVDRSHLRADLAGLDLVPCTRLRAANETVDWRDDRALNQAFDVRARAHAVGPGQQGEQADRNKARGQGGTQNGSAFAQKTHQRAENVIAGPLQE